MRIMVTLRESERNLLKWKKDCIGKIRVEGGGEGEWRVGE